MEDAVDGSDDFVGFAKDRITLAVYMDIGKVDEGIAQFSGPLFSLSAVPDFSCPYSLLHGNFRKGQPKSGACRFLCSLNIKDSAPRLERSWGLLICKMRKPIVCKSRLRARHLLL